MAASQNIFARILGVFTGPRKQTPIATPSAMSREYGEYNIIGGFSYTGEKNIGELGPVKGYYPEYQILRQRSWDLLLESEIASTIINKYVSWVVGSGLRLQAEPEQDLLKEEGITVDRERLSKSIEARFRIFKGSRSSDHSNMQTLNLLESEAFKNSKVGGDVLVVLRYRKKTLTVQLIDGANVVSPQWGSEIFPKELADGNKIVNGIEIAPNGEHVAYYVRKPNTVFETERITARGKRSGMLMAYMVYGNRYRINSHRGMPLLAVIFETVKKLERYKEAAVGSAEERQKVAFAIEHKEYSTGENPLIRQTVEAYDAGLNRTGDLPVDTLGEELANKITATTNKQAVNLPVGASLNELVSKNELYFKDFYTVNIELVASAAEIPPNVAMSKYDNNYSASRAALKDWDNTLSVQRYKFAAQFLQPIYEFFFWVSVLEGKIDAPGYLAAYRERNRVVTDAYHQARYLGTPVPHIDPVKEVEAERLKLGKAGEAVPLTTVERATEMIGGGESESNIEQFSRELKKSRDLDIKLEDTMPQQQGFSSNGQSNGQAKPKKKPAKQD